MKGDTEERKQRDLSERKLSFSDDHWRMIVQPAYRSLIGAVDKGQTDITYEL